MKKEITILSKPNCGGCVLVETWLRNNDIEPEVIDVFKDEKAMAFMNDNGFTGLPVTIIGDSIVNGANPMELEEALNKNGYEFTL